MKHMNIEIKAKCDNQNRVRDYLKTHDARFVGTDHQVDTYFNVPKGRLKLREGTIENNLIYYERADGTLPKQSDVVLYKTSPRSSLKKALAESCGVKVVVDKKREIYFIDNVKFHIDEVDGLGAFVEIEAIDEQGDIGREKLLEQCRHYMGGFNIDKNDLVACSYSDMLEAPCAAE